MLLDITCLKMVSEADLLALSSSLAYASPSCLFLLSLSLTIIHFVLLCSKRAREQSLLIISVASSFLLISILSVVVLGLPFGKLLIFLF